MKLFIAAFILVFSGSSTILADGIVSNQCLHVDSLGATVADSLEEKIRWSEHQKLTWKEFRGAPNGAEAFVASTNSGIGFSFSYKERNGVGKITYTIDCNFYPDLSWYRPERVSIYILGHEQLHFDLSAIPHNRDFKGKAEIIYNQIEADRRDMQSQYDADSDHSNVEAEEYRWRAFVKEELQRLSEWK